MSLQFDKFLKKKIQNSNFAKFLRFSLSFPFKIFVTPCIGQFLESNGILVLTRWVWWYFSTCLGLHPKFRIEWSRAYEFLVEFGCCSDPNVCGNSCLNWPPCRTFHRRSTRYLPATRLLGRVCFSFYFGIARPVGGFPGSLVEWWVPKWNFWAFRRLDTYWHNTARPDGRRLGRYRRCSLS